MIPETCPDHIPLKSLCYEFCPTKAQIRTYLTVLYIVAPDAGYPIEFIVTRKKSCFVQKFCQI